MGRSEEKQHAVHLVPLCFAVDNDSLFTSNADEADNNAKFANDNISFGAVCCGSC